MRWIFIIYLFVLSISDIKGRKVSILLLTMGLGLVFATKMFELLFLHGKPDWVDCLLGILPGVFLLFLAIISDGIGTADGIVSMLIGANEGLIGGFTVLCIGLFLTSLCSVAGMLIWKWGKKKRIPFLPFLALAYFIKGILSMSA